MVTFCKTHGIPDTYYCPKCGDEMKVVDTLYKPKYKFSITFECPNCKRQIECGVVLNENNEPVDTFCEDI